MHQAKMGTAVSVFASEVERAELMNRHDESWCHGSSRRVLQVRHDCHAVRVALMCSYEISPMKVIHTETRQSFAHFLTSYVLTQVINYQHAEDQIMCYYWGSFDGGWACGLDDLLRVKEAQRAKRERVRSTGRQVAIGGEHMHPLATAKEFTADVAGRKCSLVAGSGSIPKLRSTRQAQMSSRTYRRKVMKQTKSCLSHPSTYFDHSPTR